MLTEAYRITGHRGADRLRTLSVLQDIKDGKPMSEILENLADWDRKHKL
jgi:hypothetical protein